ncbi:MAG: hypothetical protein KKE17_01800 [Proteobacteria bacterium]|nr:hypothetical protein [Pseudomonadota bacterium]MBU1708716.1 hypothetical protein [Pseudomonadota bacterium]
MKFKSYLVAAVASILMITGCGGGDDAPPPTDQSVKIEGIISGGGYAAATPIQRLIDSFISNAYAAIGNKPDKIVVVTGNRDLLEYPINEDGSFSFDATDVGNSDIVILVVHSPTKEVLGTLSLNTSGLEETLDFIDVEKVVMDLDFGIIDADNSMSSNQSIEDSGAFGEDDVALFEEVARGDNAVTLAGNIYANPGLNTEVFARFNLGSIASITDKFNVLTAFNKATDFQGLSFGFSGDGQYWQDLAFEDVLIYPPASVNYAVGFSTVLDQNATPDIPIASIFKNLPGVNEEGSWAFFQYPYVDSFPNGPWIVQVGAEEKARFRFTGADPFDSNNQVRAPIPQAKINSAGGIVVSIEVQWFLYHGGQYRAAREAVLNALSGKNTDQFVQFEIAQGAEKTLFIRGQEVATWNATYDLQSINLPLSEISYLMISFPVGGVNNKYEFR